VASLIHATAHGLAVDDPFEFINLEPEDTGVFEGTTYYVLTVPDADTFTFSETEGGAAVVLDLAITAGDIMEVDQYTVVVDGNMDPPDPLPTPTAPTVTSSTVSGIVRLLIELNGAPEEKLRSWEVQVTSKYGPPLYPTGVASTDVFTYTAHGLAADDIIRFLSITGGTGISLNTDYYVLASGLTADAFKLSTSSGGAALDFSTDLTASEASIPNEPDWTKPLIITLPSEQSEVSIPALGLTTYAVRVRAQDVYGQFSAFCTIVEATTIEGSDALAAALSAVTNGVDGMVIDYDNILPDAIREEHIQARSVVAESLASIITLSSLIYAGNPAARHVELDEFGVRLVDADGTLVVNIPTDSTQPVYFRGEVVAEGFSSQESNDLSGTVDVTGDAVVTLANGVSAPTVAPTVTVVTPQATALTGAPGSIAQPGLFYDTTDGIYWVPADPTTGYVAHYFDASGEYGGSIGATGSTTTVTTTYGSTSHIADTAEATDSGSESQISTPLVMPRDGRITKVSIYLAGHNGTPSVRNCVWANGGTLLGNSASYSAANEGATGVGDSHQYNKSMSSPITVVGGNTYRVGAMQVSDADGWQWDRDDGSSKTTYLGSGENFDDFTTTRTETTHKPNVYITYEYDVDTRLETAAMIGVAADANYVYTLDNTGVVWKYDKVTTSHVAHSGVQTAISGTKANAGMFYDSTAAELIITTFTGTGAGVFPKFVRVNTSTLAVSSTVYSAAAGTTFNGTNDVIRGGARVSDDVLGGGAATYFISTYTAALVGSSYAYTFSGTTATQVSDRSFGQYGSLASGLTHSNGTDSTGFFYGRFGSNIYQFTRWDWTTASAIYWFAYAWYDSAGTTHETAISPRTSLTLRRRESVSVQQSAIPTGGADDPNNVRIYFKPNATDPGAGALKLQATDALTSRTFSTYNSAGAADGGGTAFPAGSPATIVSAASPGWALSGDGTASFEDVDVNGSLTVGGGLHSRWVPMNQTLVNTTRTSDLSSTSIEATDAPNTGVVALTGYVVCSSSTTGGDTVSVYNFDGSLVGYAMATGVANRDGVCHFIAATGGTNNCQIKYSVNWGSGTVSYGVFVTGYWTTE